MEKKSKHITFFPKEEPVVGITGIGGDFVDDRTYHWRGYIPTPNIRFFHLDDEEYISHQIQKYKKRSSRYPAKKYKRV